MTTTNKGTTGSTTATEDSEVCQPSIGLLMETATNVMLAEDAEHILVSLVACLLEGAGGEHLVAAVCAGSIPDDHLLLNTASTTTIAINRGTLRNVREDPVGVAINTMNSQSTAKLRGEHRLLEGIMSWLDEDGTANIMSFAELAKLYRIWYNSESNKLNALCEGATSGHPLVFHQSD